jgi:hypothetical protein
MATHASRSMGSFEKSDNARLCLLGINGERILLARVIGAPDVRGVERLQRQGRLALRRPARSAPEHEARSAEAIKVETFVWMPNLPCRRMYPVVQ